MNEEDKIHELIAERKKCHAKMNIARWTPSDTVWVAEYYHKQKMAEQMPSDFNYKEMVKAFDESAEKEETHEIFIAFKTGWIKAYNYFKSLLTQEGE